jgi:hypothetical protein
MESLVQENENNIRFNINKGLMNRTFFNEYIKEFVQDNLLNMCNKTLDDYDFIDYYSIGIKSDRVACYSELWFLDIDMDTVFKDKNLLLPVFIKDINTSSYYSLSRCNMDYDEDDDDTESNYKTIEDILKWCPKSCKSQINKILTESLNDEI